MALVKYNSELQVFLDKHGLSCAQLARLCGINRRTIQRWCTKKNSLTSPQRLMLIGAEVVINSGMSPKQLLGDTVSETVASQEVKELCHA